MSFTITIGGREAIPVRAIPFVTKWRMSPDQVADVLAHDDRTFQTIRGEPIPLTAYHLVHGKPHPMFPAEWNNICGSMRTLSSNLMAEAWDSATKIAESKQAQATAPCPEIGPSEWLALSPEERDMRLLEACGDDDQNENIRREACKLSRDKWLSESVKCLPDGVFVWRDEFEQAFHRAYKNILIVEEIPGDRELNFSPWVQESMRSIVWEGFTLATEQAQQHSAATEAPALRMQEQDILAEIKRLGYEPKALPKPAAGKAGVKSECRKSLSASPPFEGTTTFEKAWERLRRFKDIADAEPSSP